MAQPQLERFGTYLLLHKIAVGGMAEIYLAIDQRSRGRELVVIKRIRRDLGDNKEFVEMFLDEAEVIRRLAHPNIIRLIDFGQVDGRYFIALEHVWGESLGQLSRMCLQQNSRFPLAPALWVGIEVARGLEHAHAHRDADGELSPVIHRDVTTENVAVSYQGDVKILDFGIAKAKDRLARTRIGQIKGTLSYLAPEQLLGEEASPQTDIYQLGAMLYQTLLGRLPVDGKNPLELMKAIVGNLIVKPSTVVPGFPERVERVLLRAMAREPDQRFADAREIAQTLRQLLGNALADGRTRLVQVVSRVTGDRRARQQAFIDSVLQGLEVNRQVGDLFDWAAGEEAKTLTDVTADAAADVDVGAAIEREEIEATDPSISSPYAVGDERTDRSEQAALTVARRHAFPDLETVSLRPEDAGDERSDNFDVFRSEERVLGDRSIPAPVTMPNIDLPRVIRDEVAARDDLAAAEGRGVTGERMFGELLQGVGVKVVADIPPRSVPDLTPVETVIARPEIDGDRPPAHRVPEVPIEDRPTALHRIGPELLGATEIEMPAQRAVEVIDLDHPKPLPVAPPIVELRVRKEISFVGAVEPSAPALAEPLPYELPPSPPAEFDLASVATALDEEAVELSEFSHLARSQRAGLWATFGTFGAVLAVGAGLLWLWPLLNRDRDLRPVSGLAAASDAAIADSADTGVAGVPASWPASGDSGVPFDRAAPSVAFGVGVDASAGDRNRANPRTDAASPRSRSLGKLIVDAGSESAVTHEGRGNNGRSALSLRQTRGRVYVTRVANDVEVRLDYEVVDDEIKLHVDSVPATDLSYNGFAIGRTPKSMVLGNQFRIMLSGPSLGQPFKLDVVFEVEP